MFNQTVNNILLVFTAIFVKIKLLCSTLIKHTLTGRKESNVLGLLFTEKPHNLHFSIHTGVRANAVKP